MDRLTKRLENGNAEYCLYGLGAFDEVDALDECVKRLAAYEDTGLEPEEIKSLVDNWNFYGGECGIETAFEKLAEYQNADNDGRLVVLPCKVGDTVYFAMHRRVIEKTVFSIVTFTNSQRIYCAGTSLFIRPDDIGKTVFLTREAAQTALEGNPSQA